MSERNIDVESRALENELNQMDVLKREISKLEESTNQMRKELEVDLEKIVNRKISLQLFI